MVVIAYEGGYPAGRFHQQGDRCLGNEPSTIVKHYFTIFKIRNILCPLNVDFSYFMSFSDNWSVVRFRRVPFSASLVRFFSRQRYISCDWESCSLVF